MKILKYGFLTCLFTIVLTQAVFASSDDYVRIGLTRYYNNVSDFAIDNKSIDFGYNGEENSFDNLGSIDINSNEIFSFDVNSSEYYKLDNTYDNYNDAYDEVEKLEDEGINSTVALSDTDDYYVYVDSTDVDTMQSIYAESLYNNGSYVSSSSFTINVDDEPRLIFLDEGAQIKDSNDDPLVLGIGYKAYRGRIEPLISGNTFTLVNVLTLDEYLYGVVPSEMPNEWNEEALKAQAVAARTFAVKNMNKHIDSGYNLCDVSHCQEYLGYTNEWDSTNKAVDATHGEEIYYNGALIDAVYSSSSGGATANSEDVWSATVEYLRGVDDPYDTTGKDWERSLTFEDFESLAIGEGSDLGVVTSITLDDVSDLGRVNKLTIHGTNGDLTLEKENIRYFFSNNGDSSLESRLFSINSDGETLEGTTDSYDVYIYGEDDSISDLSDYYVIGEDDIVQLDYSFYVEEDGDIYAYGATSGTEIVDGDIVITGSGWGHGVGMSQHGANGMAEAGYDYKDILEYYYTGVDVE